MIALVLLLIPFAQLGVNYYASTATLMAVLVAIRTSGTWPTVRIGAWVLIIATALIMYASVSTSPLSNDSDTLRRVREAILFILMIATIIGVQNKRIYKSRSILFISTATLAVMFLFVMAQTVFLAGGKYFGLPAQLYVSNAATIPGLLDLKYSHIRPNGTFGEPSYLSFVLLSFLIINIPMLRKIFAEKNNSSEPGGSVTYGRMERILSLASLALIAVTGALCQSLSFYLAFPVLLYLGVYRFASLRARVWSAGLAAVAGVFLAGELINQVVVKRVSSGSRDLSLYARFIAPLQMIPEHFIRHPLGLPESQLVREISSLSITREVGARQFLDNALLATIFKSGIPGIVQIATLLLSSRDIVIVAYLLSCLMFNGSIFNIDKYAIICATIALYFSVQERRAPRHTHVTILRSGNA